jgi:hypothetical protein
MLTAWVWSGIIGLIEFLFYWILLPGLALTAWGFYLHRRDKTRSQSTLQASTSGGDVDGEERDSLLDDYHWYVHQSLPCCYTNLRLQFSNWLCL